MRGRSGVAVASSGVVELAQERLAWSPIRHHQQQRQQSPYNQPVAPRVKPTGSSEGVKEWELRSRIEAAKHYRTAVIEALARAAKEIHDVKEIKRLLGDLRSMSLQVVECVLEYNAKLQAGSNPSVASGDVSLMLPKVKMQKAPEKDVNAVAILAGMIGDTDFLFELPLVRRLLPEQFPCSRNPFVLAKSIDATAAMDVVPPVPGDMQQSLRALEVLRFKRAAQAMLQAENLSLHTSLSCSAGEIEELLDRAKTDPTLALVIKCVNLLSLPSASVAAEMMRVFDHVSLDDISAEHLYRATQTRCTHATYQTLAFARMKLHNLPLTPLIPRYNVSSTVYLVEWLNQALFDNQATAALPPPPFANTPQQQHAQVLDSARNDPSGDGFGRRTPSPGRPGVYSNGASAHLQHDAFLEERAESAISQYLHSGDGVGGTARSSNAMMTSREKLNLKRQIARSFKVQEQRDAEFRKMTAELMALRQELLRRKIINPDTLDAYKIEANAALEEGTERQQDGQATTTQQQGMLPAPKTRVGARRMVKLEASIFGSGEEVWQCELRGEPKSSEMWIDVKPAEPVDPSAETSAQAKRREKLAQSVRLSPLYVDHICRATVREFAKMPEVDRKAAVAELLTKIHTLNWMKPVSHVDMCDHVLATSELLHPYNPMALRASRNFTDDGIVIECSPLNRSDAAYKSVSHHVAFEVKDYEIEILLLQQPALVALSRKKWASLEQVAEWLLARVFLRELEDNEVRKSGVKVFGYHIIDVERCIALPEAISHRWKSECVPFLAGVEAELTATQSENMLCLRVDVEHTERGEVDEDNQSRVRHHSFETRLSIDELHALGASTGVTDKERPVQRPSLAADKKNFNPGAFLWNLVARLELVVDDDEVFSVSFDRLLLKQVSTVGGNVLEVEAYVLGRDMVIHATPTDASQRMTIGSKHIQEEILKELVDRQRLEEGLLDPFRRQELAAHVFKALKLAHVNGETRLETVLFQDTHMLQVVVTVPSWGIQDLIGAVEIDELTTLADVRNLISAQLPPQYVPTSYQFLFKGHACSEQQEAARKAVQALPRIQLKAQNPAAARPATSMQAASQQQLSSNTPRQEWAEQTGRGRSRATQGNNQPFEQSSSANVNGRARTPGSRRSSRKPESRTSNRTASVASRRGSERLVATRDSSSQYGQGSVVQKVVTPLDPITAVPVPVAILCTAKVGSRTVICNHPLEGLIEVGNYVRLGRHDAMDHVVVSCVQSEDGQPCTQFEIEHPFFWDHPSAPFCGGYGNMAGAEPPPKHALTEQDSEVADVWVWKLAAPEDDPRARWQIAFDNGVVKFKFEHEESKMIEEHFRIKVSHQLLEEITQDVRGKQPVHAQRVLEYSKLDLDFLVKISYDRIMTWRPVSSYGLSQEKFVKVMREAKLFEGNKSKQMNQIETIFIKEVRKGTHAVGEKHVNQDGWKALLIETAATRFPVATGKQAAAAMDLPKVQADLLQHILHNYICMVADIAEAIWAHCKLLAIQSEGKRYCAAACIQRAFRRHAARSRFLSFRWAVILLQARLRRIIGEAQFHMTLQALYEDWLLRQRYQAARRMQAVIRGFNGRVFSAKVLQEYRERLRKQFAKQREKLRAKAQARKQAVIHKEVRKVNDVQLMIIISRKDLRSFTRDLSVVVTIYIPECQKYTNFDVSEAQLRDFVKEVMHVKDPTSISIADLYAHHNLKAVLDRRLIVRRSTRPGAKPKIILSTQAIGQRGKQVLQRTLRVSGTFLLCSVHVTKHDVTVKAYEPFTSKVFTPSAPLQIVYNSMGNVARNTTAETDRQMHEFLLGQLLFQEIEGKQQLCLDLQLERLRRDRVGNCSLMLWRRYKARSRVLVALRRTHVKVVNPREVARLTGQVVPKRKHGSALPPRVGKGEEPYFYYLDLRDGSTSFSKPRLLRSHDLSDPYWRWVPLRFRGEELFVNPANGRYTNLTAHQAAAVIQRAFWRSKLRYLRRSSDFAGLMKDLVLYVWQVAVARTTYEKDRDKLQAVLNFAIMCHASLHDVARARQLFQTALSMAPHNIVVTRAYAVFLIAQSEPPRIQTYRRALEILRMAANLDPPGAKFAIASSIYHAHALMHPSDYLGLMNLAVVKAYVHNDYEAASILFRRAVGICAEDDLLLQVYQTFGTEFGQELRPAPNLAHPFPIERLQPVTAAVGVEDGEEQLETYYDPELGTWYYKEACTGLICQWTS